MTRAVSTGYYAGHDARGRERHAKVHVHVDGHGPLCGARPVHAFQWCSAGITLNYLECASCKARVDTLPHALVHRTVSS